MRMTVPAVFGRQAQVGRQDRLFDRADHLLFPRRDGQVRASVTAMLATCVNGMSAP